jgi:hypothetical protein
MREGARTTGGVSNEHEPDSVDDGVPPTDPLNAAPTGHPACYSAFSRRFRTPRRAASVTSWAAARASAGTSALTRGDYG